MAEFLLINVECENPAPVVTAEAYRNLMENLFEIGCEKIWREPELSQTYIFVNWHHSNWEKLNGKSD